MTYFGLSSLFGVVNGYKPLELFVPSFSTSSIEQSNPFSGASNTLTLSLMANYELVDGSTITIVGLTGSQTSSSASFIVSSASGKLGSLANWNIDGTLVLTAALGGLASNTPIQVTFNLVNARTAQPSPAIRVTATILDGNSSMIGSIAETNMSVFDSALYGVSNGLKPLKVVIGVCNIGYTSVNGSVCMACPKNTYKSATGNSSCANCPAKTVSPAASIGVEDCSPYVNMDKGECGVQANPEQNKCSTVHMYTDGSIYEGGWKDGKKHGSGMMVYPDSSNYHGIFEEDQKHGRGKEVLANGDIYEGEYMHDKKHGRGIYTFTYTQQVEILWYQNDQAIKEELVWISDTKWAWRQKDAEELRK